MYFVLQERLRLKDKPVDSLYFVITQDERHGFLVQYKESQLSNDNLHKVWVRGVSRVIIDAYT